MKTLILFAVLLIAFACADPEIVEKIVKEPEYITTNTHTVDTIYIDREIVINDTIFTTVTDTIYVERTAEFEYDPVFQNYVDSFFVYAEMVPEQSRLIVDITMIVEDLGGYVSETTIVNGRFLIKINTRMCYEAGVYRELLHTFYARPYINRDYHPMQINWGQCLEDMNSEARRTTLITMFIE